MPEPGEKRSLAQLGLVSRRTALKGGIAAVVGAGAAGIAGAPAAHAGMRKLAPANARRVGAFTGPKFTGAYDAHYVDLCIPVQLADGSLLLIGGDTYAGGGGPGAGNDDWRCPTGFRSPSDATAGLIDINGAVTDTGDHAKGLVPENHQNGTTAIPSDIFRVGDTLYMHLLRGPIYNTHHSDFWKSTDNGENWTYLRQWPEYPGGVHDPMYGGQFQQKTYAADTGADPYVYCMTSVFNRDVDSDLLLFRVLKSDLDKTDADADASGFGRYYAYEPWGFANGRWAWGNPPTTVDDRRRWGEICFRAMGGKYVLSWFQPSNDPNMADIRAMVFPLPTSDLVATTEQTMVYADASNPAADPESVRRNLYGGFVFPGSRFDEFHIAVSNWTGGPPYGDDNYVVAQWRAELDPNI